ncbi:MAG: hypothetical protein IM631_12470 [Cytophagales bacterium]|nr:hypothetical protein [Cytophagales bacterium]MCA6382329.1 hypothetical protein [Cytophagales bacterium]
MRTSTAILTVVVAFALMACPEKNKTIEQLESPVTLTDKKGPKDRFSKGEQVSMAIEAKPDASLPTTWEKNLVWEKLDQIKKEGNEQDTFLNGWSKVTAYTLTQEDIELNASALGVVGYKADMQSKETYILIETYRLTEAEIHTAKDPAVARPIKFRLQKGYGIAVLVTIKTKEHIQSFEGLAELVVKAKGGGSSLEGSIKVIPSGMSGASITEATARIGQGELNQANYNNINAAIALVQEAADKADIHDVNLKVVPIRVHVTSPIERVIMRLPGQI